MASYVVKFITHARRGAGTTASVRIYRLTGTDGSYGPSPWLRQGFPSGSIVSTQINTDKWLGKLTEVEVGHDSVGDAGTGWLLSGVKIKPANRSSHNRDTKKQGADDDDSEEEAWFPCGKWLGESDSFNGESGPTRVVLSRLEGKHPPNIGEESFPRNKSTVDRLNHFPNASTKPAVALKSIEASAFAVPDASKLKQGVRAKVSKHSGWAGEDAYFIGPDLTVFGVADGVSEWRETGVDAGLFSRALVEGAMRGGTMEAAAAEAQLQNVKGSSTLVICKVDMAASKCLAHVLGDSQIAVVRNGKVVSRSVEQEHSFGVPFQLSSEKGRDQPGDCLEYEWDLRSDDYLVAGTDGLFDNLADDEIARIVSSEQHPKLFHKAVALCQSAFEASQRKTGDTPYSKAASEALNLAFSGGKKDDITAIVCQVK